MDVKKQIKYWIEGAKNDLDTARLLVENGKVLHGLFFCHLVVEKAIKALVVNFSNEIPPKSHNLIYLSEKANLILDEEWNVFIGIMMRYQLEGRYPDYLPIIPSNLQSKEYLLKTEELLKWLENQL